MNSKRIYIVFIIIFGCNQVEKSPDSKIIEDKKEPQKIVDSAEELGFGAEKNAKFIENDDLEIPISDCVDASEVIIDIPEEVRVDDIQDCIFDQSTQTDEFLKDIKELEGYRWNQENKTAEIVLNDHWSLSIYRGGCDLFYITATFFYDRQLDFEEDRDVINEYVIWIVNLLEDFDNPTTIKDAIKNNELSITIEGNNKLFVNFMDIKVYESYIMDFESKDNFTKFSISNFKG